MREEKKKEEIAKKGKQSAVMKRTVILTMAWTWAMKSSWRMNSVTTTSRKITWRSQNPMQLLRRKYK